MNTILLGIASNTATVSTDLVSSVEPATALFQNSINIALGRLREFAQSPDVDDKIKFAFGNTADATAIGTAWQSGDFSGLPSVEVLPCTEINGANAAYAKDLNLIFVSQEFIAEHVHQPEAVASVLTEEIGHFVDAQLNAVDSQGDEGAIFSLLISGAPISDATLSVLQAEDDSATINYDGQLVQIEQDTITGTTGNDTLNGTTGDDTIDGLAGNDTIHGLEGNDQLIGGLGNDTLYGDAGNDTLDGGDGNDYLLPGAGVNVVIGGAGNDTLLLDYSTLTPNLTIAYTNAGGGTISDGSTLKEVEQIVVTSGAGNDTIDISATTVASWVEGGSGNDVITGGGANSNHLSGGAGDDIIYGGNGNDTNGFASYGSGYDYGDSTVARVTTRCMAWPVRITSKATTATIRSSVLIH